MSGNVRPEKANVHDPKMLVLHRASTEWRGAIIVKDKMLNYG